MTRIGHGVDENAGRVTQADDDWLADQALAAGDQTPPVTFDDTPHPADHCVGNDGQPRTARPEEAV